MYGKIFEDLFKNFWRDVIIVILVLVLIAGAIGFGIGYFLFH